MFDIFLLDLVRGTHLLCFALGMGPAIYFDLRTVQRISQPFYPIDVEELHRIHLVVSLACVGLWTTGLALIYLQTAFDFSVFSPKLWCKLIVVTALTVNALCLSSFVIPALGRHAGDRLVDMPLRILLPMTFSAGLSLACWILALALGSSKVLKVADWDLLLPVLAGGAVACTGGVLVIMFIAREIVRRHYPAEIEY